MFSPRENFSSNVEGIPHIVFSSSLVIVIFLCCCQSSARQMYFAVVVTCISLITNEAEHLFICLLVINASSSMKCLLIFFCSFFSWGYCPFVLRPSRFIEILSLHQEDEARCTASHTELVEEPGLGLNWSSAFDSVRAPFPQHSSFRNRRGP